MTDYVNGWMSEFERMQKEIHQIEQAGTLDDLAMFWRKNAKAIAKQPSGWRLSIQETMKEVMEALRGTSEFHLSGADFSDEVLS